MRSATLFVALAAATAIAPSLALPVQTRDELDLDLFIRELDNELFARKLNPTNKGGKKGGPNKPPNLPRRGLEHDAYSLWERMDLDELE